MNIISTVFEKPITRIKFNSVNRLTNKYSRVESDLAVLKRNTDFFRKKTANRKEKDVNPNVIDYIKNNVKKEARLEKRANTLKEKIVSKSYDLAFV